MAARTYGVGNRHSLPSTFFRSRKRGAEPDGGGMLSQERRARGGGMSRSRARATGGSTRDAKSAIIAVKKNQNGA
jgi:hypothetical protein